MRTGLLVALGVLALLAIVGGLAGIADASTAGCNMQVLANPNPPPGMPQYMSHPTFQCPQAVCDDQTLCSTATGWEDGSGDPNQPSGTQWAECLCAGAVQSPCITRRYGSAGNILGIWCHTNGNCPPPLVCQLQLVTDGSTADANGYFEVRCKCVYPGGEEY